MENSVVEEIIGVIRELARQGDLPRDLARARISGASTIEDLSLDSLGALLLLTALDEMRGLYIPDDIIEPKLTLNSLAAKIEQCRNRPRPGKGIGPDP